MNNPINTVHRKKFAATIIAAWIFLIIVGTCPPTWWSMGILVTDIVGLVFYLKELDY